MKVGNFARIRLATGNFEIDGLNIINPRGDRNVALTPFPTIRDNPGHAFVYKRSMYAPWQKPTG